MKSRFPDFGSEKKECDKNGKFQRVRSPKRITGNVPGLTACQGENWKLGVGTVLWGKPTFNDSVVNNMDGRFRHINLCVELGGHIVTLLRFVSRREERVENLLQVESVRNPD